MLRVFFLAALLLVLWLPAFCQQPERMQGNPMEDNPLNPLNFGLREASDGMERYNALMACHREAVASHRPVSYAGIDTIRLVVPENAASIPLPYITDFAGAVIVVRNNSGHNVTLFSLTGDKEPEEIKVDCRMLEDNDFREVPEFRSGYNLLIVDDKTPWSAHQHRGNAFYRSDLIAIAEGHSQNSTIAPYTDAAAMPLFRYVTVSSDVKSIEHVTIIRDRSSANITYCFSVANQYNVAFRNVHVVTPRSILFGDKIFDIANSAMVSFSNIIIDSSYSSKNSYGYAFCLTNVAGIRFENIRCRTTWHAFAAANVNGVEMRRCVANGFSLLCYGRDIHATECDMRVRGFHLSSLFGTLRLDSCYFSQCTPVMLRSDYNAYTPFDIRASHCSVDASRKYHAFVNAVFFSNQPNRRPELSALCLPNIWVEALTVNNRPLYRQFDILALSGNMKVGERQVDYLQHIEVNGLRTMCKGRQSKCRIFLSRHAVKTVRKFSANYKNVENGDADIVNCIGN